MKIPDKVFWKLCDYSGNSGGWVAPDGTYVSCRFAGHEIVGETISAWLSPERQPSSLTELGWALINVGVELARKTILYLPRRGLTQPQRDAIFDQHPDIYKELIANAREVHVAEEQTRHFYDYMLEDLEDTAKP